jgi:predicted acetyltransferase
MILRKRETRRPQNENDDGFASEMVKNCIVEVRKSEVKNDLFSKDSCNYPSSMLLCQNRAEINDAFFCSNWTKHIPDG